MSLLGWMKGYDNLALSYVENMEVMAEREGFEPSVEILSLRRFSKPLPSATRPPLHFTIQRVASKGRPASTAETVERAGNHRRGRILHQPEWWVQERSLGLAATTRIGEGSDRQLREFMDIGWR